MYIPEPPPDHMPDEVSPIRKYPSKAAFRPGDKVTNGLGWTGWIKTITEHPNDIDGLYYHVWWWERRHHSEEKSLHWMPVCGHLQTQIWLKDMQLSLIPRERCEPRPGCHHVPNWLSMAEQKELLEMLRVCCEGGFWTPPMPNGTPMAHPLCGLGLNWKPYEYFETERAFPLRLQFLANRVLGETLPEYQHNTKFDVAIVNYFPVGSSLGMHQDRSEDQELRDAGSPIVTFALGDTGMFRMGSPSSPSPAVDVEMQSGDVVVMGGRGRMTFHGITKILPGTTPPELEMKPGRISVTIRQARRAA